MRQNNVHSSTFLLLNLLLMVGLSACAGISKTSLSIGVLSNGISVDGLKLTAVVAQEQDSGYQAGMRVQDQQLALKNVAEGNQEDDVQVAIRKLVEQDHVIAISGATSNQASVRAAGLVNFFNVPMIIPSSYGESVLPSNNLWAFRLSPPGSSYAQYFFGTLLPTVTAASTTGSSATQPALKVAILYEENTFGESAAVATAHVVLKQGLDIGKYAFFNAAGSDPDQLKALAQAAKQEDVRLIYMISSDPAVAQSLVAAIKTEYGQQPLPVLVGQSGGFATQAFIESQAADGVFILRQQMDMKNCPSTIQTIAQAQSFAAVYLINQAVSQVKDNTPVSSQFALPSLSFTQAPDPLIGQREKVRDALKSANLVIPCLGQVAFDNVGQNKLLRFELLQVKNGKTQPAAPDQWFAGS